MIWPSVHGLVLDQMAAAHRGPNRNSRILLRLQERKGELVDRASAAALVFRLAREERDAWINWPARVAADGGGASSAGLPKRRAVDTYPCDALWLGPSWPACLWTDILNPL
jgi:hypothetical protein